MAGGENPSSMDVCSNLCGAQGLACRQRGFNSAHLRRTNFAADQMVDGAFSQSFSVFHESMLGL